MFPFIGSIRHKIAQIADSSNWYILYKTLFYQPHTKGRWALVGTTDRAIYLNDPAPTGMPPHTWISWGRLSTLTVAVHPVGHLSDGSAGAFAENWFAMPADVILHACDTWLEQILNDILADSQTSVRSSRELRGSARRIEAGLVIVQLPDDWNRIGPAIAEGAALSGRPDIPLMAIAPNVDTCKAARGHGATRCIALPLNVAGLLAMITEMLAKAPRYQGISEPS